MSTVLVAFVLLPIALALIAGLVLLLGRPLVFPALAAVERARFRRCLARAARGDAHLHGRLIEAGLRELEAAFCLMIVRSDTRLVDQIARHHAGLLARLLDRRGEMQRAYLQLRGRGARDGRRIQLERELRRNARDTRAAIRELISDLHVLSTRKVAYQ